MRIYPKVEKLLFRLDEKGIRFTKRYRIVYAVAWVEDWLYWKKEEIKEFCVKEVKKMIDNMRMQKMRKLADELLVLMREEKASRGTNSTGGGRELSLAITKFEEGSMWMIRSNFSEKEYSPLLKLQEVKE